MKWLFFGAGAVQLASAGLFGPSYPKGLSGIETDSYNGKQTTFDVTAKTTGAEIGSVLPGIFDPTTLMKKPGKPSSFSVVWAFLTKEAQKKSLSHNSLMPADAALSPGHTYQYRFAEVPNGETSLEQDKARTACWAVGLSDSFATQWQMRGLYILSNGNLAANGQTSSEGFTFGQSAGDLIDMFLQISPSGTDLDVYLAVDNTPYGHAFHVDLSETPEILSHVRPAVRFAECGNNTAVTVVQYAGAKSEKVPAAYTRRADRRGVWELVENHDVSATVEKAKSKYTITVKAANTFKTTCTFNEKTGAVKKCSSVSATRVAPSEELAETEHKISEVLSSLAAANVEADKLNVVNTQNVTLSFTRSIEAIKPAVAVSYAV